MVSARIDLNITMASTAMVMVTAMVTAMVMATVTAMVLMTNKSFSISFKDFSNDVFLDKLVEFPISFCSCNY